MVMMILERGVDGLRGNKICACVVPSNKNARKYE